MNGRSDTEEKKRAVMGAILDAWIARPHLRLGQLLENAVFGTCPELFFAEDEALAQAVVAFANKTEQAPTE